MTDLLLYIDKELFTAAVAVFAARLVPQVVIPGIRNLIKRGGC